MKKPIYSSPDVQIQQNYLNYRSEMGMDLQDETMSDDYALMIATTNRYLNPSENENEKVDPDIWRLVLDTIKVRAMLLEKHRLEIDRREKRKHIKSVPIEYLDYMAQEIIQIILKRAGDSIAEVVISDITLLMSKAKVDYP